MSTNHDTQATDNLWLSLMKDDPDLQGMNAQQARAYLEEGGFPERLIGAWLATLEHQGAQHP